MFFAFCAFATVVVFSYASNCVTYELCRYNHRMQELLQEFAVSMSSISQIYFHILNAERRRENLLPKWQRLFSRNVPKQNLFMQALAKMSDLDIAKITKDALGYSLPQFQEPNSNAHQSHVQKEVGGDVAKVLRSNHASSTPANRLHNIYSSLDDKLPISGRLDQSSSHQDRKIGAQDLQAEQQDIRLNVSSTRSGLHSNISPISRERATCGAKVGQVQHSPFELHEIVVHGTQAEIGHSTNVQHVRSTSHRVSMNDDADSIADKTSSSVMIAGKNIKSIRALTSQQNKARAGTRSLIAAIQRPVKVAGTAPYSDPPNLHSLPKDSVMKHPHPPYVYSFLRDDGFATHISALQPPPRSRSCSRTGRACEKESANVKASDDVHHNHLHAQVPYSIKGARDTPQISLALPPHELLSPPSRTPHSHFPLPPSANMLVKDDNHTLREPNAAPALSTLSEGDVDASSSPASHQVSGTASLADPTAIRSQSRTRTHPDSACIPAFGGDTTVVQSSSSHTPSMPSTFLHVTSGVDASKLPFTSSKPQRHTAATSASLSNKHSSNLRDKFLAGSLTSRELQAKIMKEKIGDRLEEC